ncbi:hypothetical protein J7F03_28410 [Streptomyces sp. ISL-43]|uniref:phage tail protein n=1 Tax=Streptomyces sp. ISL-43 TaxID=2819183 RepID=UPI001BE5D2C4|nr:hypothetical protein [Streptomyces sp. ISL-43]MBT2450928.1 hypothetical protein [Streptomyces sp. ISL-43]
MALTIGELVANINADDSGMRRGLASAELQMRGFQQDAEGRLRRLDGTFAGLAERISMGFAEAGREGHRFRLNLSGIVGALGGLGGAVLSVGKIAAMFGTAVPAAAGLAAAIGQIAPAAGVAATGMFAVVLATQAMKLGMKGVGDAVKAAMDPSNPAAFEEAIKNLAPSAQAFARVVKSFAPAFKELQQGVQQRLFSGLDGVLKGMGQHTLPVLRAGLFDAAGALNLMGKNIGNTAIGMSKSGVLGQALKGATDGLTNLSRIPSQLMLGFTQVGAAAAPAFRRITDAAGNGADNISEKISKAFESGAMTRAIDQAIVVIKQIGEVAGNVFSILGSVFKAAQASGGGMLGVLRDVSGALATAFASPGVQAGMRAVFETMATLGKTLAPLLAQALRAIAPVFTALGPPIQRIIQLLGPLLGQIIAALGPVLEVAAQAVGSLLDAVAPLLPVIGSLVAQLLPALTPLLGLVAGIFKALAPVVAQLAGILMSALEPILAALIPVIQPIVDALMVLVQAVMPIISAQMTAFAPLIAQLAGMFAQLLVALAPVIAQLIILVANVLTKMTPLLITVMGWVSKLAGVFAGELGNVINTVVMPGLQAVVALLQGDFSGAWAAAKLMVQGAVDSFVRLLVELPARAGAALASLAPVLWGRIQEAGGRFNQGVRQKRDEAIARIREIPSQAAGALGDLGHVLWNSGASLIRGFIDGIKSQVGRVKDAASGVVSAARNFFPFSPAKEGPFSGKGWTLYSGRALGEAFANGISSQLGAVGQATESMMLAGAMPGMALGASGGGRSGGAAPTRIVVELAGPQEMRELIRGIVQKTGGTVETVFGSR